MRFEVALDCRCALGEGPVWSVAEQALWFVDIKGRALHRFHPGSGAHRRIDLPEEPGSVGLARDGGLILSLRSGLYAMTREGAIGARLAANPEDQRVSRFNDGRVDPAGRFLAGTIDETGERGAATLYRFDARGLTPLVGGLTTSNGLAFSPDGRVMYHADTPRRTVWRFAYDPATGEARDRTVFLRFGDDGDPGRPDGAAVDAEGCYWTALWQGGRIQRYAPDGRLIEEHATPALRPTMIAFGGADLSTLYVTSARIDAKPEEEIATPHAGSLFAMRVTTPGLPEPLFDPAVGG
ncbi:MAG: SMP-30/gluconolactonase/LRE family protein [Methylobacteriaceae bacterium]|nr:SMP-30/gluconolactonase/LRE family protein [Methylobacteriaceae bacterium]